MSHWLEDVVGEDIGRGLRDFFGDSFFGTGSKEEDEGGEEQG